MRRTLYSGDSFEECGDIGNKYITIISDAVAQLRMCLKLAAESGEIMRVSGRQRQRQK